MALVIGSGVVLTNKAAVEDAQQAVMGFDNIVSFDNVSATSETVQNPIANVTNPATSFTWEALNTATQTITIQADGRAVDYIGIARHNLNQIGLTVEIKYNGVTVLPAQAVTDRQALIFLLSGATPTTIDIIIAGATTAPKIAVLYAGKALILERNIYVGHTPITYGRDRVSINGMSENGQYLGEIVVRETNSTSVSLQNLTPDWYRIQLDPFFAAKPRVPCFFAWRSNDYPTEIGYCWAEGSPRPVNQRSNGMMSIDFDLTGIA